MTDLRSAGPAKPDPRRRTAAAFVLVAVAMDILDTTIVIVALPDMERDLGAGSTVLQWITAAYTLTFALTLITAGRIGDRIGRRLAVQIGILGFVVTSAVCALAPTAEILVAGRVAQALAGSLILTQALAIFQVEFPEAERPGVLGVFGAVLGSAAVLGPILGGVLVAADIGGLGWRTIFWINLPIGLVAFLGVRRYLRESRAARPPALDPSGLALLTLALFALLLPLVQGRELGWPWWGFAMVAAGFVLLVVFARSQVRRERAGAVPLVLPRLWRERSFVGGLGIVLTFLAAFMSMFFVLNYYLQVGLGFGPLGAGLTLVPSAVSTVVFSLLSTPLLRRFGTRVLTVGALVGAVGLLLLTATVQLADDGLRAWWLAPALLLVGSGMGLVTAPVIDVVLTRVPADDAGAASGVLNTAEQLGAALGVAAVGTVFFGSVGAAGPGGQTELADALGAALWVNIGLMLLSAALSLLLPRRIRRRSAEEAPV
ncbi:putative transmembrane efflux protein [Pseudonocardia sp. Ae717_Ps2]|uniref:MFS transporter n=1 Tax=Pseudonocardia sp. Ae717_Ps2 TaxID=1885573 RepID=UPI00094B1159|nr:MFS transporter [Pseudonocardia sp. Ae717_Ps2]OLM27826.1 putative transmembrane efflux protein [Pseudonocardia sp. Ae717_Ps2]